MGCRNLFINNGTYLHAHNQIFANTNRHRPFKHTHTPTLVCTYTFVCMYVRVVMPTHLSDQIILGIRIQCAAALLLPLSCHNKLYSI